MYFIKEIKGIKEIGEFAKTAIHPLNSPKTS